jgi:hypothetical protein
MEWLPFDLEEKLQGASSIGWIIKAMRRAHSQVIASSAPFQGHSP